MERFVVRIELYGNASWQHYQRLRDTMARYGFARTITSDSGVVYDLPSATYYKETDAGQSQVLSDAKNIADSIWNNAGVLVSKTSHNMWRGLQRHSARFLA